MSDTVLPVHTHFYCCLLVPGRLERAGLGRFDKTIIPTYIHHCYFTHIPIHIQHNQNKYNIEGNNERNKYKIINI